MAAIGTYHRWNWIEIDPLLNQAQNFHRGPPETMEGLGEGVCILLNDHHLSFM